MKYFFAWCAALVLAGAGAWYVAGFSGGSDSGAKLIFKGPDAARYGEPFELAVGVSNATGAVWKDVGLALTLPPGLIFADGSGSQSFVSKQLGDLGDGSLTNVVFELMPVEGDAVPVPEGQGGDAPAEAPVTAVSVRLSYTPAGGTAVFEKYEDWQAPAPAPAIDLSLAAPEKVSAGEEFKIEAAYANGSEGDLDGVSIEVEYPASFAFAKASADPDANGTEGGTWNVGAISKGSSDSFAVFGRIKEATTSMFAATAYRSVRGAKRPIARAEVSVVAEQSPLTVEIDANDSPDYVAHPGDTVTFTVSYVGDGLKVPKGGIMITASPSSPLFDLSTIVPRDGGTVRRSGSTGGQEIAWTIPGSGDGGGSVGFTIRLKGDYGIRRLSDRNFTAKMHAEVKIGSTVGSADKEMKIGGRTDIGAKAYFRDADAGIVNKGSVPPKAGVATEYTIHWALKNQATDVKGIEVRATLPEGVRCTGTVKSTIDTKPACDAAKNEVVWKVARMSATTGVLGKGPEAIFQVAGTPTAAMAGKYMPLVGTTTLSAMDDFSGAAIATSAQEITTALPDDLTVGAAGIVVP